MDGSLKDADEDNLNQNNEDENVNDIEKQDQQDPLDKSDEEDDEDDDDFECDIERYVPFTQKIEFAEKIKHCPRESLS